MKQHYHAVIKAFLTVAFVYLFPLYSIAQCAGIDTSEEICNFSDPSYQTLNLFTLLDGNPQKDGVWNDDDRSGALNTATGILNVWKIRNSGSYHFTYTVTNASCGTATSVLTLIIGPYAGVDNMNAAACETDTSVNLFQFYGDTPSPQANGVFVDNNASGAISGNFFDANAAGPGTYAISYVVSGVGNCPDSRSDILITVQPKPEAGTPSNLILCENEDLSPYANFDLNSLLNGEDSGGEWRELSGTGEVATVNDHIINVQQIYEKNGPGTYEFQYTVYPSHPVCNIERSNIKIIIEKQYDFSPGTFTVNSDICENEIGTKDFTATLTEPIGQIENGYYNVSYEVTNTTTGDTFHQTADSLAYNNAVATFTIDLNNNFFKKTGNYKVTITQMGKSGSMGACANIIDGLNDTVSIFSYPDLTDATLTVNDVCRGNDATAIIQGATLLNGNYGLAYELSGANQAKDTITTTFTDGKATFTMPTNTLNSGKNTIKITAIKNATASCENTADINTTFNILPVPDIANLNLNAANICIGGQGIVNFQVPNIATIYVTYTVSGANNVSGDATLNDDDGDFTLILPTLQVKKEGNNTITINTIQTEGSACAVTVNASASFTIFELPKAPEVKSQPQLCAYNAPTIVNLAPNGEEYRWYAAKSSSSPLNSDTPLEQGTYWVSKVNLTTGCESERVAVPITLGDIASPSITKENTAFCGLKNPTVADLSAKTIVTEGELIWYDAALNGNPLAPNTPLEENKVYYGYTYDATTGCFSSNHIETQITLSNCDADDFDFYVPDGFSPNGDGINDTFKIPNINYIFPDYSLKIYNRYGKLLFEGNANTPDWDGSANQGGTPINGVAPSGVYFYILDFNKNNLPPKQGRLYLNQ